MHAVVQQCPLPDTPQMPLEHWLFAVHAEPRPATGTQVPLWPGFAQKVPGRHPASVAHDAAHEVPLHMKNPQLVVAPLTHTPVMSHVLAVACELNMGPPVQVAAAQTVPAGRGPQVPSAPFPFLAALQARHVPVHEVSQHTPSTQEPLMHSIGALHGVPFKLVPPFWQPPLPSQTRPVPQAVPRAG